MTAEALALFAAAATAAVGNWLAVWQQNRCLVHACKPLTLALLVATTCALEPAVPTPVRWWFVAALVLSLAGDVFLMLPRNAFIAGLASFLFAHVAYTVGMNLHSAQRWWRATPVIAIAVVVGARLVRHLRAASRSGMIAPVVAYVASIAAMAASAFASGNERMAAGAALFVVSDALIGEERFVRPRRWQPLATIVTYHVAQGLLVLSLA